MSEQVRANRVSVQAIEGGFKATFYRTHKTLGEIVSTDTDWVADARLNRTAQRELFRVWICDNATKYGYQYDAVDRRTDANAFPSKYTDENMLGEWACKLVSADIQEWMGKLNTEMGIQAQVTIECDGVQEVHEVRNGKEMPTRYSNGNWAWAKVGVCCTVKHEDTEAYVTMDVALVSGQLKKPSAIGSLGYTYTGFKTEIQSVIKVESSKNTEEGTGKSE